MQFLFSSLQNQEFRENSVNIFTAMFAKGMLPNVRLSFVSQIFEPLEPLFSPWISQIDNLVEGNVDFVKSIADCISQIIDSLCFSYKAIETTSTGENSENDQS